MGACPTGGCEEVTPTVPNASWPLPALLTSLANAGWGDLAGREHAGLRATLRGLEALLPHGSAKGHGTAWQVAQRAGLSERWTRRCLGLLEDLGIIRWQRGTIIDSRPEPSRFTVVKSALVRLIRIARGEVTRRLAQRRRAFIARLQHARNASLPRHHWKNPKPRAELSATRTHLRGGTKGAHEGARPLTTSTEKDRAMSIVDPPPITPELMPDYCSHFASNAKKVIYSCPDCRRMGTKPEDWAEYDGARKRAEAEEHGQRMDREELQNLLAATRAQLRSSKTRRQVAEPPIGLMPW